MGRILSPVNHFLSLLMDKPFKFALVHHYGIEIMHCIVTGKVYYSIVYCVLAVPPVCLHPVPPAPSVPWPDLLHHLPRGRSLLHQCQPRSWAARPSSPRPNNKLCRPRSTSIRRPCSNCVRRSSTLCTSPTGHLPRSCSGLPRSCSRLPRPSPCLSRPCPCLPCPRPPRPRPTYPRGDALLRGEVCCGVR